MPALVVNLVQGFNFPRSYVRGLVFDCVLSGVSWSGNLLTFHNATRGEDWLITFLPRFRSWNSNVYSLDFCIDGDASQATLDGVDVYYGLFLSIVHNVVENGLYVKVGITLTGAGPTVLALPPAPGDYWLPVADE